MKKHDTYEKELNRLVDQIFTRSDALGMSLSEMATIAGLNYATVYRLDCRITKLPRIRTVMALARCVGMRLDLSLVQKHRKSA